MPQVNVFTDGGSRGNPGPSALGVYIENERKEPLAKINRYLGYGTNNFAEYSAIIEGLTWIFDNKQKHNIDKAIFYMDSQLAYSQLIGIYRVKNEKIKEFIMAIRSLEEKLHIPINYNHIRRENNKKADTLVNFALDNVNIA